MSRRQRGNRSSGGRNHAAKGGAVVGPSPPGAPIFWFDFTDTSTLWQDTAGTSAVTADGQDVFRIDNKGSVGGNLQNGDAGAQPDYDVDGKGGCYFDGGDVLTATITEGMGGLDRVVAVVYNQDGGLSGTDYIMGWHGLELACNSTSVGRGSVWDNVASMPSDSGTTVEVVLSYMADHVSDAGDDKEGWFSYEGTPITVASATDYDGPGDSTLFAIGGFTATASWIGGIREVVVWASHDGAALIEEWKTYTTTKHGITWA